MKTVQNLRNSTLTIILAIIGAVTLLLFVTSCGSTLKQKVENAEADLVNAEAALEAANKEYETDLANYRAKAALRIAANEKAAAEFKVRIFNEKKVARAEYLAKIAELEQRNTDMKKRIEDYQAEGRDNWALFKDAFNKELDEFDQALQDLTKKKE